MATLSSGTESTILVVEDEPATIRLIEEAFDETDGPFTYIVVTDGIEAFDVLHNRGEYADTPPPDLILLDLHLPGQPGQQILSEIRTESAVESIPVIVFSSVTDPDTIAECYRLGASAYVVKPTDFERLLTVAEHLIGFWIQTAETPPE